MGTSQSSKGPPSNVPMVPPWVPNASLSEPEASTDSGPEQPTSLAASQTNPVLLAPVGRFGGARTRLNSYARTGDKNDMKRGVGQYVKKGYGGKSIAVQRFGGTTTTASALYGALSAAARGEPSSQGSSFDPAILSGRSAREVIDAVIETVCPTDGTQDTEVHRASIDDALSDLLNRDENADLLNLSEDERSFIIDRFVAQDVFRRFELDLGASIHQNAPSVASALSRLKEVREYIRETVSASFKELREANQAINSDNINKSINQALYEAFDVFEDYAS